MTHSQETADRWHKAVAVLDRDINWRWLPDVAQWVIDQAQAVQQIAAPTFAEQARAEYVAGMFRELGLQEVETDDVANVYGRLPGAQPGPGLMLSAHTDTVFPAETDLSLRSRGRLIYGPGLGDNSVGVAGMMGVARALRCLEPPPCDLWLVATSREEGLGDLGGMKVAYERLRDHIKAVINIEGLALGYIYHAGIAVRRLRISAQADGGHSWLHYGRASAIHGLIELGNRILAIEPPPAPRTTYNIGLISGGHSINSIATRAEMWLDLRSEASETLHELEDSVHQYIDAQQQHGLSLEVEVVGDRPAGSIPPEHPLVQMAQASLARLGLNGSLETGSTDGNVSLAANCPTVTVGVTRGGNAHRLDEYMEVEPVEAGMRQIVLLTLAAAEWQPTAGDA